MTAPRIFRIVLRLSLLVLVTAAVCAIVCFFIPRRTSSTALVACAERAIQPKAEQAESASAVQIIVAEYLYHTGIILPVQSAVYDWTVEFPHLRGKRFVELGWGDSDFYMSGTVTVGLAIQALFFSRSSVMNLTGLDAEPFATQPTRTKHFCIRPEAYKHLVATVLRSFARSENGNPVWLREGFFGHHSAFFAANAANTGAYSIANNCNVWNSNALHSAGIATPLWAGIPQPLMWMLPDTQQHYR